MKNPITKHIGILLAVLIVPCLLTACMSGRNKEPEEVIELSDSSWIMEKYFQNIEGYDKVTYEQVYFDWHDRLAVGPTEYRYRGVISFTEEQAAALMDKYEWEQVTEAPSFEFGKLDKSAIGQGPWYGCKAFEQDNLSTVDVKYAVFDGTVLVFDFRQY